ncbi:MAG: hypothetical protein J5744_09105 [Oscillospiraceae bacterium]|nr:hypothetical protein [Oscillospiraceae bacterium]
MTRIKVLFMIPQTKKEWALFVICMIAASVVGFILAGSGSEFEIVLFLGVVLLGGWAFLYPIAYMLLSLLGFGFDSVKGAIKKATANHASHTYTPKSDIETEKTEEPVPVMRYSVLPRKDCSYATDANGEPLRTYYRPSSGLFCSTPSWDNDPPFFLNIRKPILMDVKDKNEIEIPELPADCDGIIFKNYGTRQITAFFVKDKSSQSMRCD